jgi:hypothetical protein
MSRASKRKKRRIQQGIKKEKIVVIPKYIGYFTYDDSVAFKKDIRDLRHKIKISGVN